MKKKNDRAMLGAGDSALFDALRAERSRLAREQNVPAYVIFHDATLAAIATARPASLDALGEIPGMGRTKVERYGATVLAAVAAAKS
jgi:ATP-dependent DNA helicase RecQ